jgi:hypothetical protein
VALNLVEIPKRISNLCDNWLSKPKDKIGALVIKLCLILLTSFFFATSGCIPGLYDRERGSKKWWSKEAS